jgi:hypothetical protein
MFGNLFGQEDKEREKRAQEAKKRQADMFARMNSGGPDLHSRMAGQAAAHQGSILEHLQNQNKLGTVLGMDVQKANARRVSEGRDRQADVIRELIRANAETEKERLRLETAKLMSQRDGLADLKAMNRMG